MRVHPPTYPLSATCNSLRKASWACIASLLSLLSIFCQAQATPPVIALEHGPNASQQLSKHYVILVSFDGFRYDYARQYHAQNLLALADRGASAPSGMIPSYPTVTLPNHYTIISGLYPGHHGIVANHFYDPARKEVFGYRHSTAVTDGSWYGGTPLWVLAEQQGMRSACFFWIGSEAAIQGARPSYYVPYDEKFPFDRQVDQALAWLRLPAEQRPHFIALYFSEPDNAGHAHGPDSPEVAAAVGDLDRLTERLLSGLKPLKLPVDVIIVADHGMASVKGAVYLDQLGLESSGFERIVDASMYPKSEADAQRAYETLRGKSDKFDVYRRAQLPAKFHLNDNPRAGDPVVVATGPYLIRVRHDPQTPMPAGMHGYDPDLLPEMKAVFIAAGPDIRSGVALPSFENVDVYPFVAKILGLDITNLKTGPIDGKLNVLQHALK